MTRHNSISLTNPKYITPQCRTHKVLTEGVLCISMVTILESVEQLEQLEGVPGYYEW